MLKLKKPNQLKRNGNQKKEKKETKKEARTKRRGSMKERKVGKTIKKEIAKQQRNENTNIPRN